CATSRCVELKLEHCKNGTAQKQLKCIQEAEDECVKARSAPYRHLLGCTIAVELVRPVRCCTQKAGKNNIKKYKVTRSTSGRAAGMVDNVYLAPTFHRPYFDIKGNVLTVDVGEIDEKWIKIRTITIDYLRQPSQVTLSELDITAEEDNSQELEFPQDVAEEITKKAVTLILERNRDPRLAQNVSVNQTINDIGLGVQ
ncbi:MAG: hypothetical protein KAH32_06050, partial [Chlamydiia bacterium]|nr:hypothetical protein [Chlamydiia bacterium]